MLFANMGIPMVCIAVPTMLVALLPIAAIESVIYWRCFHRAGKDAFVGAFLANGWSTLIGVPFTWLLLVIAQLANDGGYAWGMDTPQQQLNEVTLQAAWLIPYREHLYWMIPAASIVLLLPFYLGSAIVEFIVLAIRWRDVPRRQLVGPVLIANAFSYSGLGFYYGWRLWVVTSVAI